MPDYLHSAPAAWSQSRADVQPDGCVATNALLVFARVYWSAPAAAASRPLHINYLHIIVHKWAASERGRWKGGGRGQGGGGGVRGAVSMWNLAVGLCAVHRGGCLPANCLNSVAGPLSLQPHHIRVWKTASTQQNQQGVVWHHGWQTAASPPYIWKCGCNIVQHDREKKTSSGGNIFPQDLIYKSIFICMYLLCMAFWCRFPSQTFSLEQHFNQNSMKINYLSMHGDYPSPCTATGLHLV